MQAKNVAIYLPIMGHWQPQNQLGPSFLFLEHVLNTGYRGAYPNCYETRILCIDSYKK
jgi:hypothetical protein